MTKYQEFTEAVVSGVKQNLENVSLNGTVTNDDFNRITEANHHLLPEYAHLWDMHTALRSAMNQAGFERKDYGYVFAGKYATA